MKRRIAVVHDRITSGGFVLPYEQTTGFLFEGRAVALIGGEAYCVMCKSRGLICPTGGDQRLGYGQGRQTALDGDLVLCKCATKPRIIALLAGESWCDDGYEPARSTASPVARSTKPGSLTPRHDEQFTLRDANGYPLANTYYTVRLPSGSFIHGVTDEHGCTGRHVTDDPQRIQIYIGHREA